jgi:hypothetical protein
MKTAILWGVKNWPNRDFFIASVSLDIRNRACSTSECNLSSPVVRPDSVIVPASCKEVSPHFTYKGYRLVEVVSRESILFFSFSDGSFHAGFTSAREAGFA